MATIPIEGCRAVSSEPVGGRRLLEPLPIPVPQRSNPLEVGVVVTMVRVICSLDPRSSIKRKVGSRGCEPLGAIVPRLGSIGRGDGDKQRRDREKERAVQYNSIYNGRAQGQK
jgi:hypothetical protein